MTPAPDVTLNNGVAMPALGLGTWPLDDAEAERTIAHALRTGYRLVDTAENYRNERGVGRGVLASGLDRDEVFVTTKFNREWHSVEGAQRAWSNSADLLGLDVIDLLLIHWPNPDQDRYVDAWRGLIELLEAGKVRAIGTSNFTPDHLQRLIDETGVTPHVNQIQLHPYVTREAERAFHAEHGIVTESWSPLGKGTDVLTDPVVTAIADEHDRTPAQVVLRWHLQLGCVPIPKSQDPDRLRENLDVFDLELSDDEMAALTALDRGGEGAADPESFGH